MGRIVVEREDVGARVRAARRHRQGPEGARNRDHAVSVGRVRRRLAIDHHLGDLALAVGAEVDQRREIARLADRRRGRTRLGTIGETGLVYLRQERLGRVGNRIDHHHDRCGRLVAVLVLNCVVEGGLAAKVRIGRESDGAVGIDRDGAVRRVRRRDHRRRPVALVVVRQHENHRGIVNRVRRRIDHHHHRRRRLVTVLVLNGVFEAGLAVEARVRRELDRAVPIDRHRAVRRVGRRDHHRRAIAQVVVRQNLDGDRLVLLDRRQVVHRVRRRRHHDGKGRGLVTALVGDRRNRVAADRPVVVHRHAEPQRGQLGRRQARHHQILGAVAIVDPSHRGEGRPGGAEEQHATVGGDVVEGYRRRLHGLRAVDVRRHSRQVQLHHVQGQRAALAVREARQVLVLGHRLRRRRHREIALDRDVDADDVRRRIENRDRTLHHHRAADIARIDLATHARRREITGKPQRQGVERGQARGRHAGRAAGRARHHGTGSVHDHGAVRQVVEAGRQVRNQVRAIDAAHCRAHPQVGEGGRQNLGARIRLLQQEDGIADLDEQLALQRDLEDHRRRGHRLVVGEGQLLAADRGLRRHAED